MWFRNLQIFRLSSAFTTDFDQLESKLQAGRYTPCSRMDMTSTGWVPPLGRDGQQLTHAAGGCVMLCLRTEDKILPAGVIRQLLEEKVAEREAADQRRIFRREKQRMKEEITVDLLPRALSRWRDQYAYLDLNERLLIVDAASVSKAEAFITRLRESLGRFPCHLVKTKQSPTATLTHWLYGNDMPQDFELGEECELRHPDPHGGIVSCKRQDLESGEVRNHVKNGKQVARMALQWNERLTCMLHEDMSVRRLRFTDVVLEQSKDNDSDEAAVQFDLDFALMTLELAGFVKALVSALGGELPEDTVNDPIPRKPVVLNSPETA